MWSGRGGISDTTDEKRCTKWTNRKGLSRRWIRMYKGKKYEKFRNS